ncbi:dTMP kinase [Tessaracoccus oleiagri]|uniref:Thymidylate kinase n=1 Tax=Tessaracoccus oleiagri TaxID=686624 RepID=A0A1G9MZ82_9ACTN|nr:dTMP kinase [Tessaracoccus oleiagri]SDL79311.1 dTMP kinase [Tessaracoccus oleiagri]
MSGLFVVFEGGDSVGKSTQVRMLTRHLAERGVEHLVTRQPGGTELGAELRRLILDPASGDVDHRAEALMYAADKAQHVHQLIRPALASGMVVVSDRYVDSMIAYQGAGRALDVAEVSQIAWWAVDHLRPDLTVLLDTDPAAAVATIERKDRLEAAGLELHRRARHHFLDLAAERPAQYLVLDARDTRERIAAAVAEAVDRLLRTRENRPTQVGG